MKIPGTLFSVVFLSFIPLFAQPDFRVIHDQSIVIDLHNDAILRHVQGRSLDQLSRQGHIDLPRMKKAGLDVAFFALWPDSRKKEKIGMFDQTVVLLDSLQAIIGRNPASVQLTTKPDEIGMTVDQQKTAICIGIEGGAAIESDLKKLDYFYQRGVRYLGLTWNENAEWATAAKEERQQTNMQQNGLTEFGKQVIRRMNELGMIIDLAHSSEQTFYDVLKITTRPVIVSHANVWELCPHYRNLKDAQLRALAQNGGLVGITFLPGYLVKGLDARIQVLRKQADALADSLQKQADSASFDRAEFIRQQLKPDYPDVRTVVDHIYYIINLVGEDYVAIGSDFDGISLTPLGLDDVTKLAEITREMAQRGYSQQRIRKIWGENFLRVFREVSNK